MTNIEHRAAYAAKQREDHANDAAAWYAVAQEMTEWAEKAEAAVIAATEQNAEILEKQKARILELEGIITALNSQFQ